MTTTSTTYSTAPRRNAVAAIITAADGSRVGHVVMRGLKFTGCRKIIGADDMRRTAPNFRTVEAAAAWVAKAAANPLDLEAHSAAMAGV